MYRENYIDALRQELLDLVEEHLTPAALQYGYSEVPLEVNIKWRPQVLILGNYSSGKSTLINDLLGAEVQKTGQAPTDDSFTVITYDDATPEEDTHIRVTEERDGKVLLNDPEFPFDSLRRHGERFAAHFRMKKVNAPFLRNLAIIDTPGMLDSITERDRGYNYQQVIGDLAHVVDLVLVLFDPHKAGTVREAHESLRDTLPAHTFEDRIVFVLNRIDECSSLLDLLQVYGTLCWNLSQMTGRKDIPNIHLTYSPRAAEGQGRQENPANQYLNLLGNQREGLKRLILDAPRYRLDHLASFVEIHGERLAHMLEGLISYRRKMRAFRVKSHLLGLLISVLVGGAAFLGLTVTGIAGALDPVMAVAACGGVALLFWVLWSFVVVRHLGKRKHRKLMEENDDLTPLNNQARRDTWASVKERVAEFLKGSKGQFSLHEARGHHQHLTKLCTQGTREVREALKELASIPPDEEHFLEKPFLNMQFDDPDKPIAPELV